MRWMISMFGLALMLSLAAPPLSAQSSADVVEDAVRFDVMLRGLRAGELTFAARQDGTAYRVSGKLESAGLVGMLRKVRYDASARGSIRGGRYVPDSYAENTDTGRRQSQAVMDYRRGVPQVKSYTPPREPRARDLDPATQGGTVDPLTALYATLRDAEPGRECNVSLQMFDGRRRTQLQVGAPRADGDRVVCAGEYRRLQGFSADDMAEKTRFPFTLTYAPGAGGRMQVVEVAMDTLFGTATMVRR